MFNEGFDDFTTNHMRSNPRARCPSIGRSVKASPINLPQDEANNQGELFLTFGLCPELIPLVVRNGLSICSCPHRSVRLSDCVRCNIRSLQVSNTVRTLSGLNVDFKLTNSSPGPRPGHPGNFIQRPKTVSEATEAEAKL